MTICLVKSAGTTKCSTLFCNPSAITQRLNLGAVLTKHHPKKRLNFNLAFAPTVQTLRIPAGVGHDAKTRNFGPSAASGSQWSLNETGPKHRAFFSQLHRDALRRVLEADCAKPRGLETTIPPGAVFLNVSSPSKDLESRCAALRCEPKQWADR